MVSSRQDNSDNCISLSIEGPGFERLKKLGLELHGLVSCSTDLGVAVITKADAARQAEIMEQQRAGFHGSDRVAQDATWPDVDAIRSGLSKGPGITVPEAWFEDGVGRACRSLLKLPGDTTLPVKGEASGGEAVTDTARGGRGESKPGRGARFARRFAGLDWWRPRILPCSNASCPAGGNAGRDRRRRGSGSTDAAECRGRPLAPVAREFRDDGARQPSVPGRACSNARRRSFGITIGCPFHCTCRGNAES